MAFSTLKPKARELRVLNSIVSWQPYIKIVNSLCDDNIILYSVNFDTIVGASMIEQ